MSLLLVGLNHKTAPLEVRERLAFSADDCRAFLPVLIDNNQISEALILSTCNRVEILLDSDAPDPLTQVVKFLAHTKQIAPERFAEHLYAYSDAEAVRHLFAVTASLDSMIIGETQILGQVKEAYRIAVETGTVRRILHKLLHQSFKVAKRIRTETRIGANAVSVSFAAVELSRKIFCSLKDKTVLLVGAGEMAEAAAKSLCQAGAQRILICNRTFEKAVRLAANFAAETVSFDNLAEVLPQADIVICAAAAPNFLIKPETVARSLAEREQNPQLFIDISVPRNIAPKVASIEKAFLYSVDDLEAVVAENLILRQREAARAAKIVDEETAAFWISLQTMSFGEKIGNLRQKFQSKARAELEKNINKLGDLTPEQTAAIERLLLSTVNQITHPILYGLRRSHEYGAAEFAETLCDLLGNFED
jgi:glutamyl-tRNA reductase